MNFYQRFIPQSAQFVQPLAGSLKGKTEKLTSTDSTKDAFVEMKQAVSSIAFLAHLDPSPSIALVTDVPDKTIMQKGLVDA